MRVLTALTQIITSNSWGFLGTFNGHYDLVIIGVHAVTKSYFIVHNALSSGLKIYHVTVTCLKCLCCARYTVISALCILTGRRICPFPVFNQLSYIGFRRSQFFTNMLLPTQHTVNVLCNKWSSSGSTMYPNTLTIGIRVSFLSFLVSFLHGSAAGRETRHARILCRQYVCSWHFSATDFTLANETCLDRYDV
jgi:hypothetical protein